MAKKDELRAQRTGTIINQISSKQEKMLLNAIERVRVSLLKRFPSIRLEWEQRLFLVDVIKALKVSFPNVSFASPMESSSVKPDGGFLYMVDKRGKRFPVLITEKKNQGTNDLRAQEGKKKQAKGNAIERLGKNVIGLRAALLNENIFPFICFGDGCDFEEGSSILDRVITIAMFGKLNVIHLHNTPPFNRGSFYFRDKQWTEQEMFELSEQIAVFSVFYYFSKYGEDRFCLKNDKIRSSLKIVE